MKLSLVLDKEYIQLTLMDSSCCFYQYLLQGQIL